MWELNSERAARIRSEQAFQRSERLVMRLIINGLTNSNLAAHLHLEVTRRDRTMVVKGGKAKCFEHSPGVWQLQVCTLGQGLWLAGDSASNLP
jgi:hypothetical protein